MTYQANSRLPSEFISIPIPDGHISRMNVNIVEKKLGILVNLYSR